MRNNLFMVSGFSEAWFGNPVMFGTAVNLLAQPVLMFKNKLLRYLSFCQTCWHLAVCSKIVKRWRTDSLVGCEVLGNWNWISFLSSLCIGFSVLASPCVSDNACLVFQLLQFGTGLSTGFTQCHYLSFVQSSFPYLEQWTSSEKDIFIKYFFPQEGLSFNGFNCGVQDVFEQQRTDSFTPCWFFLGLLTNQISFRHWMIKAFL